MNVPYLNLILIYALIPGSMFFPSVFVCRVYLFLKIKLAIVSRTLENKADRFYS